MISERMRLFPVFCLVAAFLLAGCKGELARVHFESVGENQITFDSDGSPIEFWTDMDVEYVSLPSAVYEIKVYQDGSLVAELECDPFDVSYQTMARRAEVSGTIKQSYLGLMQCGADLPVGELTLEAALKVEGRMTIFRADLVLKKGN